jgi:hypothetical protein
MKGTFFSADFVVDNTDDLRLIEINTDTGIVSSQKDVFDWSGFITILEDNSITKVDVVYKWDIQRPIVESLSASLATSASFVTEFNEIVVPGESIFPTSPSDATDKFILRMAYDEAAILDSEYAKGTLSLLKLFANNGDTGSITNFYHSSSYYGYYNTLDTNVFNGEKLPDIITKPVIETHNPHKFYKVGHSDSASLDRYNDFIGEIATPDYILQQYHIPQSQKDSGIVKSIRSFQIVYGSNLDLCYCAEYEIGSVLELPTGSFNFDDTKVVNLVDSKHYYEFATNTIKNRNHGLLENETILDINGNEVEVKDLVLGDEYKSYFISGSPNTDDYDVLRQWSSPGSSLPSGSYETSSILVGKFEDTTFANDLTEIVFDDNSTLVIGGEARMLVYDEIKDVIRFERVVDLNTGYSLIKQDGTLSAIADINLIIYNEQQPVYTMNMEEVDNFILANGGLHSFYITHNLGISGGCFVAGTKITMADGSEKNIEEIVDGDEVLSFDGVNNEPKKVSSIRTPNNTDLVKYVFANQTELVCTFDHPIFVSAEGFSTELASYNPFLTNKLYQLDNVVKQIKVGDLVFVCETKSQTAIKDIIELDLGDTQTYIFEVEDNHNFYANGILVHNK